jgi:hypothetical protein
MSNTTFDSTIEDMNTQIINTFVETFKDGPGKCSSDRVISQSTQIFIGPNADLGDCKVNVGQKIDLAGKKICLDINKLIKEYFSGEDSSISGTGSEQVKALYNKLKSSFDMQNPPSTLNENSIQLTTSDLNSLKTYYSNKANELLKKSLATEKTPQQIAIESIISKAFEKLPSDIKNKTQFINACKEAFAQAMLESSSTINATCSQEITVSQNQNIYLLGKIRCEGGSFDISQDAIVKNYIKCIVEPSIDEIKKNPLLKVLYNIQDNVSSDCIYDKLLIEGCSDQTKKRKYKIRVLSPAKLGGKCVIKNANNQEIPIVDNQEIEEDCFINSCSASEWSRWSMCSDDGFQQRTRTIVSPGINCPTLIEKRVCKEEVRERLNQDQLIPIRKRTITPQKNNQNWFIFGFSNMPTIQKIIFYGFLLFLIISWLYSLFY